VANEASNRRRAAGRRERLSLRLAQREDRASGGAAPSPEATVLAASERRDLLEAVNRLREEDRMVLACRFFLELSDAETAAVLGWPLGTVKSRGSRALGRLRALMAVEGRDEQAAPSSGEANA
jgi:RNA polymerase sigma-70 factor (ECF subfamily)